MIHIPYWWDQTPNSLLATLNHHRPDLIGTHNNSVEMGSVIPSLPPSVEKLQKNIHSFIPVANGSDVNPLGK